MERLPCFLIGVCGGENVRPTIKKSRPASDSGGFTANDPGSFLCQGLFDRGNVRLTASKDADATSDMTAAAGGVIMNALPSFQENFKVRPLSDGHYLLMLIPGISGLPTYSAEFVYP